MNEYLCKSYIAGQILSDMSMSRLRRRLDDPSSSDNKMKITPRFEKPDFKETLLYDEGSSSYKEWLKKQVFFT